MFFFSYPTIDQDTLKIEKAIETKLTSDKRKAYEKYITMYLVTKEFIKKKKLLLYGGLAINLSLPKTKRFYDDYELPDYDFFSYDAQKHAKELADVYNRLGYEYIEVKPGIHDSTYKVFVDFQPVADITDIPRALFNTLMSLSMKEKHQVLRNNPNLDISIVPLSLLRLAFHIELSRPDGFIERWTKIYKRMVLFYSYYPLVYEECVSPLIEDDDSRVHELNQAVIEYCKNHNLPLSGLEALKIYMRNNNRTSQISDKAILDKQMALLETISTDYETTTKQLAKLLNTMCEANERVSIKHHSPLNNSELIPKHYMISLETYVKTRKTSQRPLAIIYNSRACYSYKKIDDLNVLTIDAILSMAYAYLFTKRNYYKKDKTKCMINILLNLQAQHINSSKYIWKRFELECVGNQPKIEDVKKQQWHEKKAFMVYRPNITKSAPKKI